MKLIPDELPHLPAFASPFYRNPLESLARARCRLKQGSAEKDAALCIFHTHTINQFSPEARDRLSSMIADQAAKRDLFRISIEWLGGEHPVLELVSFENGVKRRESLAYCDAHGEWLEWTLRDLSG